MVSEPIWYRREIFSSRMTAMPLRLVLFFFLFILFSRWGTFLNFLPVLQLSADSTIAARNDLLSFLQSFSDLPVTVITDPDFHWDHFNVVAIENEDDFNRFGRLFVCLSRAVCGVTRKRIGADGKVGGAGVAIGFGTG